MESFGLIVDCVTLAFVTYAFVLLYEISNRLEKKDKQFDILYERSSCPPHPKKKKLKEGWKRLKKDLSKQFERLRTKKQTGVGG